MAHHRRSAQPAPSNRRDAVDTKVLEALAENSGGRAFLLAESYLQHGLEIQKVLTAIADELRGQYTIGYYPATPDDGRYHSIKIRTTEGYVVRARRGYVATRNP